MKGQKAWNKGIKMPQYSGEKHYNWQGGKIIKKCLICKKEFRSYKSALRKYCSIQCYWKWKKGKSVSSVTEFKKGSIGPKSVNWKGGKRISKDGYINIWNPTHPFASKRGVLEHRLVAEKCLGRYLIRKEIVHHINKIRNDNRPENLYLFPNQQSHMAYHILLKNKLIKPIVKSNLT